MRAVGVRRCGLQTGSVGARLEHLDNPYADLGIAFEAKVADADTKYRWSEVMNR